MTFPGDVLTLTVQRLMWFVSNNRIVPTDGRTHELCARAYKIKKR